jgi:hypothetical protein
MFTLSTLTEFLGWTLVIHVGLLMTASFAIMLMGDSMRNLHARMFRMNKEDLPPVYLKFLGYYKVAIYIFSLVPYIALKIMA